MIENYISKGWSPNKITKNYLVKEPRLTSYNCK